MYKSKEELFDENTKLVHYVIHNKFQGFKTYIPGYDYEDIVQIGNFALWKACKTFNFDKKINFSTYAIRVISNEILIAIRNSKKNMILNNSISLNDIISNNEGGKTEFGDLLISNKSDSDLSISELKAYINDKYKNSEIKLNVINSYIFKNMNQCEIGKMYGYSQAHISRILKKFKSYIKKDFEGMI